MIQTSFNIIQKSLNMYRTSVFLPSQLLLYHTNLFFIFIPKKMFGCFVLYYNNTCITLLIQLLNYILTMIRYEQAMEDNSISCYTPS